MDSCGSILRTRKGSEYMGCIKPEHNLLLQRNSPPCSYLYTRLLEITREKKVFEQDHYIQ